jgi:tRNA A37 methylthiotransferase MiaB
MRRFGSTERFLDLLDTIRTAAPAAGVRSNVIVGFPGETDADVDELARFLAAARLDAIGVFGYSDEDGTEAAELADKVHPEEIAARVERITSLAEELTAQRAEERLGQIVEVLVDSVLVDSVSVDSVLVDATAGGVVEGRAEHQAPEVDGTVTVSGVRDVAVGDLLRCRVVASAGVDLVAEPA